MSAETVAVELGDRSYTVAVGDGVLSEIGKRVRSVVDHRASRAFVVRDTGVPEEHLTRLVASLQDAGFSVTIEEITPSERIKSLATYERVMQKIASTGHARVDPVVALGGGIVCDIAGFVASSYRRGVPIVQCPTTLLAMVDASVGGKTGVNLSIDDGTLLKNLVGAFHQPKLVCADVAVLDSLEPRQTRSGLSECIKHAQICDTVGHAGLADWTRDQMHTIRSGDRSTLIALVARNVALKASVVAKDEHESPDAVAGGRMLLNFGHTFGHAIETIAGVCSVGGEQIEYDDPNCGLYHGEAVALGMIAACRCAQTMGMCAPQIGDDLVGMLRSAGLGDKAEGLPGSDEIIARMGHDKKAIGSSVRVILPTGIGSCTIVDDAPIEALIAGIDAIRA